MKFFISYFQIHFIRNVFGKCMLDSVTTEVYFLVKFPLIYTNACTVVVFPRFTDGDIVNASICPSISPSICPPCYLLLNHWTEFNQSCYMTSLQGKSVTQQHYFSLCPMWALGGSKGHCLSVVTLSPPKPLGGI